LRALVEKKKKDGERCAKKRYVDGERKEKITQSPREKGGRYQKVPLTDGSTGQ